MKLETGIWGCFRMGPSTELRTGREVLYTLGILLRPGVIASDSAAISMGG